MSKFTPGPWQIRSKLHDDWGVIRSASGDLVARAGGWPYPTEEELSEHRKRGTDPYQANANLISAAPELYEALKAHLTYCETGHEVDFNRFAHLRDRSLAKADGK